LKSDNQVPSFGGDLGRRTATARGGHQKYFKILPNSHHNIHTNHLL